MKRMAALVELSREHHTALPLALNARRAADAGGPAVAVMAAKVVERFYAELKPHFDAEERLVLPILAEAGESVLVARTLGDHAALTALVEELLADGEDADPETLRAFADRLTEHVRFEEREVFVEADRLAEA